MHCRFCKKREILNPYIRFFAKKGCFFTKRVYNIACINETQKEGYKKCLNVRMIALLAPAIAPLAKSPKASWFPQMR